MPLNVHIKHAGKVHDVELDTDRPPTVFKEAIYQVTGVPSDRMKVMIKGGMLKDDHDWKKVAPKEGQTFMVIGAAGELPKPPAQPIVFLEDMQDSELAEVLAIPGGMKNLGNTCYMAATLQALRAVPELQTALNTYTPNTPSSAQGPGNPQLTVALRDLYAQMSRSTESVIPVGFLQVLRQAVPQFGEMHRGPHGSGYAQQDAEECWVQLTNALNALPGTTGPSASIAPADVMDTDGATSSSSSASAVDSSFIKQYMTARMRRELKCDESTEEPPSVTEESVPNVACNISMSTNYMHNGILDSLNQKIEKHSPTLGREAVYSQNERLSRLPTYLTVHMVRFAWKRDINKKAKIMRRVKFPTEFDVLDLVTDELKAKLQPVNSKLKDFDKDRRERAKVRKRTKAAAEAPKDGKGKEKETSDVDMADATASGSGSGTAEASGSSADAKEGEVKETTAGAALEDEAVYRAKELKELEGLIDPSLRSDVGCSVSGLYDLVAIITHKGAAADSGHYIGFVKKSVVHGQKTTASGSKGVEEEDEDWYKFDDEKVSIFPKEKLETLAGGGEDSSAYVLLYRSKALA